MRRPLVGLGDVGMWAPVGPLVGRVLLPGTLMRSAAPGTSSRRSAAHQEPSTLSRPERGPASARRFASRLATHDQYLAIAGGLASGPGSGIRTRGRLAPPPDYQSGALGRSSHASVARCAVGAVHISASEVPPLVRWISNYARPTLSRRASLRRASRSISARARR